jgi:vitamin B12 transporter
LYDPFFGNPDLMPERSKSWEAGPDYTVGEQRFSITYFENNISDLIVFDASINKTANLNEANINGVELAYQGRVLGFNIGLRVTFRIPKTQIPGSSSATRGDFGSLTVARIFGRWKFGEVQPTARASTRSMRTCDPIAGLWHRCPVATYVAKDWKVDVRWNNIFDKDYALAYGYLRRAPMSSWR